ncbi:MAG: nucleotidyl transferase AbiEii/AbiGii toxin family protein, partial [Thermoplasmata archaeon]
FTGEGLREAGKQLNAMLKGLEGFSVKSPRLQRDCLRCDAYFNNDFGEKDRIRIEATPAKGDAPSEGEAPMTLLQSPFTAGQASQIKTYSRVGLIVRKIHTLSERLDGKDVFDLVGMWSSGVSEEEVLQEMDSYAKGVGSTRYALVSGSLLHLEKMGLDMRSVANSANHFIPRSERPEWSIMFADLKAVLEGLIRLLEEM